MVDAEPEQKGEKRLTHRMQAELPAVMLGYKAVEFTHPDYAATEVIRGILSEGESSRLYESLIYDQQIATDVSAFFRPTMNPGLFVLYAQAKPGVETATLESGIYKEIARLAAGDFTDREVQKAKNQMRASVIRELKDNAGRADRIAFYEVMSGDYKQMMSVLDRIDRVTREDVARVARERFQPDTRTVVTLIPEQPS